MRLLTGLKISDALAQEDASGDAATTYANIIAVKKGDESGEKIKALIAALETDTIKDYIATTYSGAAGRHFLNRGSSHSNPK